MLGSRSRQKSITISEQEADGLSTMPYNTEMINPMDMAVHAAAPRISFDDLTSTLPQLPNVPELPERQKSIDSVDMSDISRESSNVEKPERIISKESGSSKKSERVNEEVKDALLTIDTMTFDLKGGQDKRAAVLFEYHNMLQHNQNVTTQFKNLAFFAALLICADIPQAARSQNNLMSLFFCFPWALATVAYLEVNKKLDHQLRHLMMTMLSVGVLVLRMFWMEPVNNEIDPWYALIPCGIWLVKSGIGWAALNLPALVMQIFVAHY